MDVLTRVERYSSASARTNGPLRPAAFAANGAQAPFASPHALATRAPGSSTPRHAASSSAHLRHRRLVPTTAEEYRLTGVKTSFPLPQTSGLAGVPVVEGDRRDTPCRAPPNAAAATRSTRVSRSESAVTIVAASYSGARAEATGGERRAAETGRFPVLAIGCGRREGGVVATPVVDDE
jgi:hypothetical protein